MPVLKDNIDFGSEPVAALSCALILLVVSVSVLAFPETILRLFGYIPFLVLNGVFVTGEFFLRLSGEPSASHAATSALQKFPEKVG